MEANSRRGAVSGDFWKGFAIATALCALFYALMGWLLVEWWR